LKRKFRADKIEKILTILMLEAINYFFDMISSLSGKQFQKKRMDPGTTCNCESETLSKLKRYFRFSKS